MINIAICDDEKYYRDLVFESVKRYLDEIQMEYHIDIYESGMKLCHNGLDNNKYDIAFLDINMDEMDGIETAKNIRSKDEDTFIVFITAFVNYSPEGYKVNAIRYLLKDNHNFYAAFSECMDTIIGKMQINKEKIKLSFLTGEKDVLIDKIIYIESKLHKLELHLFDKEIKTHTLYGKLDDITKSLESHGFLRIHQSFLVNIKYVSNINNYKAFLDFGQELPVPKIKFKAVKEAFIMSKGEF